MNPNIAIAILLITFVLLIMIKCPITFSMIISTAVYPGACHDPGAANVQTA